VLHRGHGRVARKLVGLTFETTAPVPVRGEKVLSGDREIGMITSAVRSPMLGRAIGLGYVHREFTQAGTPVIVAGLPATVTALPFVDPHTR
jgi:glycine cleavage system aminomethyltransferase T